jgi:hypothetical protein
MKRNLIVIEKHASAVLHALHLNLGNLTCSRNVYALMGVYPSLLARASARRFGPSDSLSFVSSKSCNSLDQMKLSTGRLDNIFASQRPAEVEKLIFFFSVVGQYVSQSRGAEIDEEVMKWHDIVLDHTLSSRCKINGDYERSLEIAIGNCLLNGLCKR